MKKLSLNLNDSDYERYERDRGKALKNDFLLYLLTEHENGLPGDVKYKELITVLSDTDADIKRLCLREDIGPDDKLKLFEELKDIKAEVKKLAADNQ